jgi:hypothetical protein
MRFVGLCLFFSLDLVLTSVVSMDVLALVSLA